MNHISQSVTSSVMNEYGEFLYCNNVRFRKANLASYYSAETTLEEFKNSGGIDDRLFFINFSVNGAWLQVRFLTREERDAEMARIDSIYKKDYGSVPALSLTKEDNHD